MLGLIGGYAVRDDAIQFNPVRDVQRLPLPERKTSILTPPQIAGIRELMEHWREDQSDGPQAKLPGTHRRDGHHARHVGARGSASVCDAGTWISPPHR